MSLLRKLHIADCSGLDPQADSDFHLDTSSVGLDHPDNLDTSVDPPGQLEWLEKNGQGAPHDENDCYLYSQTRMGMPVVPFSPTPNPSCLESVGDVVPFDSAISPDKTFKSQDVTTDRPDLKRGRLDENSPPVMPCRAFGGLLTNSADQVGSVPIQALRLAKRQRRLRSPFDVFGPQFAPREPENHMEEVFKELNQAVKEQTKVLVAILEVLQERRT
ncbi:hypothetical protein V8E55_004958, partial [Tylopilus felleus]